MWLTRTPSTILETTLFGKVLLLAGRWLASFVDQSLRSIQDAGSKHRDKGLKIQDKGSKIQDG